MNEKKLQAVIDLRDNLTKKVDTINNTLQSLSDKSKQVSKSLASIGKTMASAGATVAKVGAGMATSFAGTTLAFNNHVSEIEHFSKMSNMSTKQYQEWDKVLKSVNYSMEDASGDFAAMGERMVETQAQIASGEESMSDLTAVCKALGLSVTDSNGNLKDTGTFMQELMVATNGLSSETEKQAVLTALLSTTGENLHPVLDKIINSQDSLSEGEYITENQFQRVAQFKQEWNKFKTSIMGVIMTVGEALMPVLQNLMESISPVIERVSAWINENPKLVQGLLVLSGVIIGVGAILGVMAGMFFLASGVMGFFGMITTVVGGMITAFGTICTVVGGMIAFLTSPIGLVILAIIALTVAVLWLRDNWDMVWTYVCDKFNEASSWVDSKLKEFGEFFSNMFDNIMTGIQDFVDSAVEKWNEFVRWITTPVRAVVDFATSGGGNSGQRSAYGTSTVPRDNTIYRLHQGEKVLTANQARQLDNGTYKGTDLSTGINITIQSMSVRNDSDINQIASELVKKINQNKIILTKGY